jgi:hypothetical protein
MDALLAALEGSGVAQALRTSRWGYAGVNALHILGIALLVGAAVPLNLRLLGFWRGRVPREAAVRLLVPVAAGGLALAIAAGLLLFSVRAREYSNVAFLQAKLALVIAGTAAALLAHFRYGFLLETAPAGRLRFHAFVSLGCWIGALACGRLIAFAGG